MATANVVTSGLAFERRASILRSPLAGTGDGNKEAIALINQIAQGAKRNHLVHGMVSIGAKDGHAVLLFVKRMTDQRFTARVRVHTSESLRAVCKSIALKRARPQDLLGISPEDREAFSNIGLILSSKAFKFPTSPKAESSEQSSTKAH